MTLAAKPLYLVAALLGIVLVSGCQTVGPKAAVIQKEVRVGDDVIIGTKDGKKFSLRVTSVTDAGIAGLDLAADTEVDFDAGGGAEAIVDIPFDQIETIEIEERVKIKFAKKEERGDGIDVIDVIDATLFNKLFWLLLALLKFS